MQTVDLHFTVVGDTLPTDHGYALNSAIAERLPALHPEDLPLTIGAVRGSYVGNGALRLDKRSWLRLRVPAEHIPAVLPLAGQDTMAIAGRVLALAKEERIRAKELIDFCNARLNAMKPASRPSSMSWLPKSSRSPATRTRSVSFQWSPNRRIPTGTAKCRSERLLLPLLENPGVRHIAT